MQMKSMISSVLEQDTLRFPYYWLIPREWQFLSDMTEKLLTGAQHISPTSAKHLYNKSYLIILFVCSNERCVNQELAPA